jgi:cyclophilin family peptidyl-prolyl cis-trans isomerase
MGLERFLIAMCFFGCLAATGVGQEDGANRDSAPRPAAEPATGAGNSRKPGKARVEFDRLFAEWTKMLGELAELRQEYRDAAPLRKPEVRKRYQQLANKGFVLQPQFEKAAIEAFQEAPDADLELARLLLGIVNGSCRTDRYEKAWEFAQPLIEAGVPDPELYTWAGVAAMALGHIDAAEKYIKAAYEAEGLKDSLEMLGDHWFAKEIIPRCGDLIPYYRDAWAKEKQIREAESEANLPRVRLQTTKGTILLELFENEAPNTVANFISLVEKGFYDGVTFHRVLNGFMAQSGCPDGTGQGGPGYNIPCECYRPDARLHFRGSISMANTGERDTGGSQFFLTFVPTPHLDGRHTVFGRVIEGMEVLSELTRLEPKGNDQPEPEPDKIIKATVVRKRDHEYLPKKMGE